MPDAEAVLQIVLVMPRAFMLPLTSDACHVTSIALLLLMPGH